MVALKENFRFMILDFEIKATESKCRNLLIYILKSTF